MPNDNEDGKVGWSKVFSHQHFFIFFFGLVCAVCVWQNEPTSLTDSRLYYMKFSVHDPSYGQQRKTDTVPFWVAIIIWPFAGLLMFALEAIKARLCLQSDDENNEKSQRSKTYHVWRGFFFSFSLLSAFVFTYVFWALPKQYVGRPRPDFLESCVPSAASQANVKTWELVGVEVCTNPDGAGIRAGLTSFPSGHSAFSWGAAGWALVYFAWSCYFQNIDGGKQDSKRAQTQSKWWIREAVALGQLVLVLCLPLLAWFIAFSRIHDNRHHPADVLAGSLVGVCVGGFMALLAIASYNKWQARL